MNAPLTAAKAAHRLTHILDAYATSDPAKRFPVDVQQLALGCADLFQWNDPIARVEPARIKGFEGALIPDDGRESWLLLYNDSIRSAGRIRFTQAHELGHYILHRRKRDSFRCSEDDMLDWQPGSQTFESEADEFASYLLMPLNDFRAQITATVDLDVLGACATRYGVSLTAAILKWLSYTDEKAIVIMSNDGFMNWSCASTPAFKAGAYFATKQRTIPLPAGSLAADVNVEHERVGREVPVQLWFQHADPAAQAREMKIYSDQYDRTISLLLLPRGVTCWAPR